MREELNEDRKALIYSYIVIIHLEYGVNNGEVGVGILTGRLVCGEGGDNFARSMLTFNVYPNTLVNVECKKCKKHFDVIARDHLRGVECPTCFSHINKNVDLGSDPQAW